jgi:hypothetical protein
MWIWRRAMLNKLQYNSVVLRKKKNIAFRSVVNLDLFLPQIQHTIK